MLTKITIGNYVQVIYNTGKSLQNVFLRVMSPFCETTLFISLLNRCILDELGSSGRHYRYVSDIDCI